MATKIDIAELAIASRIYTVINGSKLSFGASTDYIRRSMQGVEWSTLLAVLKKYFISNSRGNNLYWTVKLKYQAILIKYLEKKSKEPPEVPPDPDLLTREQFMVRRQSTMPEFTSAGWREKYLNENEKD